MGQAYSFQSINPEGYDEVRLSSIEFCDSNSTVRFPFGQKPANLRDSALWEEFGRAIDEELQHMNKNKCCISGMLITLFVGFICFGTIMTRVLELPVYFNLIVLAGFLLGMVVVLGLASVMVRRNQEADRAIAAICSKYTGRFQQHEIVPEYRTKYTELCKPKGARPLRLLVFRPAVAKV